MEGDEGRWLVVNQGYSQRKTEGGDGAPRVAKEARIKADSQRERTVTRRDHPARTVVEGIAISYRSVPPRPKTHLAKQGERERKGEREKNKAISERKHAKSIAAAGSSVPGTLRLRGPRGKVTTARGNAAAARRDGG